MDLNNVKIVCSEITGELYIARFGKDKGLALDKRPVEGELMFALVVHMMFDAINGSTKHISLGNKSYKISVEPIQL
jgi:hypothetical protein